MKHGQMRLIGVATLVALTANAALAQRGVLFQDDLERGWENAMTHAFLPGWRPIPGGAIAGIWMQKLQSMTIEMSDNEFLSDNSGQLGVEFQGPRLVRGNVTWTDYTWEVVIDLHDDDGVGLLYRYQDEDNFYRLTFADQGDAVGGTRPPRGISVQRVVGGVYTEIFLDTDDTNAGNNNSNPAAGFKYDGDGLAAGGASEGFRIWRTRVICRGSTFRIEIDGIDDTGPGEFPNFYTASFDDPDPNFLDHGKVGMHTWGHNSNEFSDMSLTLMGNPTPEFTDGTGAPDPMGWVDATEATLSDPFNFLSWDHSDPFGPIGPTPYAGVECGPASCVNGGFMGSGTGYSGIGLRPDLKALGIRDNRWVSGVEFVIPDDPGTPEYDPDLTRGTFDFDGPRAVVGDTRWDDYVFNIDLKAFDNDGIGILYRYQDEDNYYRLMFQSQELNQFGAAPRGLSVQKRLGGTYEEIFFDDNWIYTPGERWNVDVTASGADFAIHIIQLDGDVDGDGFTEYDYAFSDAASPLLTGKIGVTAWGAEGEANEVNTLLGGIGLDWTLNFDEGAVFDNVLVSALGGCVGDLDNDGDTDLADLGILLADFGCTPPATCPGDLDGDGDTDLADLGILLADFGCTP